VSADLEQVASDLAAQEWIFAKTMPTNPHEYTLRKLWRKDEDFVRAVTCIRESGYVAMFRGRPYLQLDLGEHFYWTMGAPIEKTILINRKRLAPPAPHGVAP